jgi:hypothetical protein
MDKIIKIYTKLNFGFQILKINKSCNRVQTIFKELGYEIEQ